MRDLEEVELSLDELESIRLADLEGLYQEDASGHMCISRQTFANILVSARSKIAECLIKGKALRMEGGKIEAQERDFLCQGCHHTWSRSFGSKSPSECPQCQCPNIELLLAGQGWEAGPGKGCRRRKRCCKKNPQEEPA